MTPIRRLLFVDDEPQVLQGLRLRLHRQRSRWEMYFVDSGEKALEILSKRPMDVIISDMRMSPMDGATLLSRVRDRHPHVIRLMLSGYAELEASMRALSVVHQFLTKPCDAGVLERVIERACNVHELLNCEALKRIVGRIEHLPSVPQVYTQLTAALANEHISTRDLAKILLQDTAMCAKILQVANSAFFRLQKPVTRIDEAIAYLGINTLRQVVMAVGVFQEMESGKRIPVAVLTELQEHAAQVAMIASKFFKDRPNEEDSLVAGFLHDIGKLVLWKDFPKEMARIQLDAQRGRRPTFRVEQELLGVSHAEVGGYLLGLWGLPYPLVEAVANHHEPSRAALDEVGPLAAIHAAEVWVTNATSIQLGQTPTAMLDPVWLETSISRELIEAWKLQAEAVMKRQGGSPSSPPV